MDRSLRVILAGLADYNNTSVQLNGLGTAYCWSALYRVAGGTCDSI